MKRLIGIIMAYGFFSGLTAQQAPDFTAKDINGNTHNLYTYLNQQKYVLLDFTASW